MFRKWQKIASLRHKQGLLTMPGLPKFLCFSIILNYSPELWKDLEYDQKSDIWSLGCVLFETVCLYPPFRADDMEGLYRQVVRGIYEF